MSQQEYTEQQLERMYEEMLATMASYGWTLILEDFERIRRNSSDVRKVKNLDFARGQLDILDLLAGWKNAVQEAYDTLKRTPAADAE